MEKESEIKTITRFSRIYYAAYADLPTTNLRVGEAGFATDRKVLYRWSGAAWGSISISSRHGNYAAIGDPADYPESSLYQADDQGLLYMVITGAWEQITTVPGLPPFAAGDVIAINSDTARETDSTAAYIKLKEILIATGGTVRVCFDLKSDLDGANYTAFGRIYKNGVAHGTERTEEAMVWTTFSEDLAFVAGDLVQLYAKCELQSRPAHIRNLRLKSDTGHMHLITLD